MVLHKKDCARQAKWLDGRHQEPLLNLSRRSLIAGACALVIGLTLRGGAATADSTAGGLRNVGGGDATPSLWIANELPRSKLRGINPKTQNLRRAATGPLGDAIARRFVLVPAS
jgi:hypothetical protein